MASSDDRPADPARPVPGWRWSGSPATEAAMNGRAMTDDDPFLWLEEVEGEAALGWVAAQNARSLAALESDPRYGGFTARRWR